MIQISLVPVRELTTAICVEATPARPPESLLIISSANWCANLRTCASVGVPRYTLPITACVDGLRTSNSQPEITTSEGASVKFPKAIRLLFSCGVVQSEFRNSPGTLGTCVG